MRVFLNPQCNYGTGRIRWEKVSDEISRRIGVHEVEEIISPEGIVAQVSEAYSKGERNFIAAGGDGTVNLLLNAIMTADLNRKKITLGAVGLGSSNDYHKPFRRGDMVHGTPVRLNLPDAQLCDVLRICYLDVDGSRKTHFCLCNASIGVTADANAFFNLRSRVIKMLQRISVEAAIIMTALRTIVVFRNVPCVINVDHSEGREIMLSNLSIIKNPHFTGSLCYDTTIQPNDGKLGVYLCFNQSLLERIATFVALYRHRFKGRSKTECLMAEYVVTKSDYVFALEMDGEVVETSDVEFSVMPKQVRCCR